MIKKEDLRYGIPVTGDPYGDLSKKYSMEKKELIEFIKKLIEDGEIIKIRALLDHRKLGFKVNALIAMKMDGNEDPKIMDLVNISHFYIREPDERFPYNYYAMAHFRDEKELEDFSERLKRAGIKHEILRTVKNLKRGEE